MKIAAMHYPQGNVKLGQSTINEFMADNCSDASSAAFEVSVIDERWILMLLRVLHLKQEAEAQDKCD